MLGINFSPIFLNTGSTDGASCLENKILYATGVKTKEGISLRNDSNLSSRKTQTTFNPTVTLNDKNYDVIRFFHLRDSEFSKGQLLAIHDKNY